MLLGWVSALRWKNDMKKLVEGSDDEVRSSDDRISVSEAREAREAVDGRTHREISARVADGNRRSPDTHRLDDRLLSARGSEWRRRFE